MLHVIYTFVTLRYTDIVYYDFLISPAELNCYSEFCVGQKNLYHIQI